MTLVDTIESKDERTSQERVAVVVDVPIPVRKGQHLDVDAVLARSLPTPGAYSNMDVKTIVLR